MNAVEFVKKFGYKHNAVNLKYLPLNQHAELERLVESHKLVSNFGGLKRAKRIIKKAYTSFDTMISVVWNDNPFQCNIQKLEQAISDVESCQ